MCRSCCVTLQEGVGKVSASGSCGCWGMLEVRVWVGSGEFTFHLCFASLGRGG